MSLREIVQAYKKECFGSLRLKALVFEELRRRPVGCEDVMGPIFSQCSKAHGKYSFNFNHINAKPVVYK